MNSNNVWPLHTTSPGAHGVREEPQFVTARAGENVILGCDVSHPLNGQPYVVEWFKYGMPIPFFINFRFYPPHVDPEYAGKNMNAVSLTFNLGFQNTVNSLFNHHGFWNLNNFEKLK